MGEFGTRILQMNRKQGMPSWVYWVLWGVVKRDHAMRLHWVCMLVGLISLMVSFSYGPAFCGVVFLLVGRWYWQAIRWVDMNGEWEES